MNRRPQSALLLFVVLIVGIIAWEPAGGIDAQAKAPRRTASWQLGIETPHITSAPISAFETSAENIQFIDQLDGFIHGIAVQGNYAYIGNGAQLAILDVSNPASPMVVGTTTLLPHTVLDVAVSNGYAFVAVGEDGLSIVDVRDPSVPVEIGRYNTPGTSFDVAVAGSHVFIADYHGGLRVIDVTDPAAPAEIGSYAVPFAEQVTVDNDYAYVVNGDLHILSIADPAHPSLVSSYTEDDIQAVVVVGNYAYLSESFGLRTIDISDPSTPSPVDQYQIADGQLKDVTVSGNFAYVTGQSDVDNLYVFDVSDPGNIVLSGVFGAGHSPWQTLAVNGYLYTIADGLYILSIADPTTPTVVGTYFAPSIGYPFELVVAGDFAYGIEPLSIIDVADPRTPRMVSSTYIGYDRALQDIVVSGHQAYIVDFVEGEGQGLYIVDVSDPAIPQVTGFIETSGSRLDIAGEYAFVTGQTLHVIHVANPSSPTSVTTLYLAVDVEELVATDTHVYYAGHTNVYPGTDGVFKILDVSDPTSPDEVGFYDTPGRAYDVALSGSHAYLAGGNDGLRIINVADPTTPTLVGRYQIAGVSEVEVKGTYAYILAQGTLYVLDVSDPTQPSRVGFFDSPGDAVDITLVGDYIYLNDATSQGTSILVLRHSPTAPRYSISGRVTDQLGAAVGEVSVCTHDGTCTSTDSNGYYSLSNLLSGNYIVTATKRGYTLTPSAYAVPLPPNKTDLDFTGTSTGNVPIVILQEAQSLVDSADNVLASAEDDAIGVIEEAIYFRGAAANYTIQLASGLFTGLVGILHAGASNTSDLPADMAFSGWKTAVLQSPFVCKFSNAFVQDVTNSFIEQESAKRLVRLALNSGIYGLAAYHQNKCLGDLREDLILDSVEIANLLLAHLERPFAQTPIARKIADSRSFLEQQMATLRAAKAPPMDQMEIEAYVADLGARRGVNFVYRDQLTDALLTLQDIHAANEAEPLGGDVLQLVLRSTAQFGAERIADGPGHAAVTGLLTVFDSYMNSQAMLESYRMLVVADGTLLKTAPEVVQQVTDNTNRGLEQIVQGDAPVTPQGSIVGVQHFSGGKYLDPLALKWQERESFSLVTIRNIGTTAAHFHVVGRYLGETTRLSFPWATLWLRASSDSVRLLPGESTPVRLTYRDGHLGYSPREARTNVPASNISVVLLAVNDTGMFRLDADESQWRPTRAITGDDVDVITFIEQSTETEAAVVDEVLVSAIDGGLGQENQTGFIWVNNPFETAVPVAVTQPLPDNVTVIDSGGGSIEANGISWIGTVGPLEAGFFEYSMVIDSPPGTVVTFPAATLEMTDPGGQVLTIAGEAQAITMPWPVLIDRDTPDWIPPHTTATVTVRATNFAAEPVDGAFAVEVVTAAGQRVTWEEKSLSVAGEADQEFAFDWPNTLDLGDYEVRGFLILDGNENQVFADPVAVGAPPPRLTLAASPISDDGTVALGGVLDYAFTIENMGAMALTNVVASMTMPADMEVISISDSGTRVGAEIRWSLAPLSAAASRTLTVQARVPGDFVAPNQGRYLESMPFLTAAESPDATGAAVTVLVLGPEEVPPTITGFSPTSGPVGTSVTISGANFTDATAVTFNSVNAASFTVNSVTQITAVVPAGATTGKIAVTTPGGTATSAGDFTVIPTPTITSFSPTSGPVGTSMTISGANFTGATAVTFNDVNAASFTVNSAVQITATVPAGATTGKIAVTTPGGTAASAGDFTVIPAPTITGFTPPSGPVGTSVAIAGANFNGATAVTFNGVSAASFTVNTATQITVVVPAGATTGKIAVTTLGGTATSASNFTITAPPASAIYLSPIGTGTIAGKAFTGADILSYVKATNTWDVFYDGSYIKTANNVGAFAFQGGDIILGFSVAQVVPGLGAVKAAPQDLIRFTPTSTSYNNTAGSFAWFFDGSDVGLTTSGEIIDALWIDSAGRLYISTAGTGVVPQNSAIPAGAKVNFQDEDVLRFTPAAGSSGVATAGTWELYWNPTSMTGMSAEDINGYWEDPATGHRYATIVGTFSIGNAAYGGKFTGNGKTILRFAPNAAAPGGWAPAEKVTWLAPGATFPSNIDGIEMAR